ncbi:MAG TPA: alkaline phosphatase family protein [Verrucomicrobiae bacterium]|nr:alkaline phosphatase family protein [Verrucomicrobiae bacterium]
MQNIEHVVVVMMENRSFDNLLGWLYDNETDPPAFNIPEQQPPTFDGLSAGKFSNVLNGRTVYAAHPPTAWPPANNPNVVPTPDPQEEFPHVTAQLFGTSTPATGATPDMSGFLADYATTAAGPANAGQIMQSFGLQDANVINQLARSFAVCDAWFASVPTQTWPNRGFVHTGSSDGHINNDNYELYNIPTIFNVLQSQGKSWGVFHNTTLLPSLTLGQFFGQLAGVQDHFYRYDVFQNLCRASPTSPLSAKLPAYSFVEPRFMPELGLLTIDYPNDYHPPHNVCRGEQFLADVYQSVRNSPYRDSILLVILFDEHGGTYDHTPPPSGAAAPQPLPTSRDGTFDFSRFGVRVPAIVISSYVQPGAVFRSSPGEPPYDHTSVLATLRDWLSLAADPNHPFLPSTRIQQAPTLDRVLTLDDQNKNVNWPNITAQCVVGSDDQSLQTPLNDVQRSLIAAAIRQKSGNPTDPVTSSNAAQTAKSLGTYQHALNFLHPATPSPQ